MASITPPSSSPNSPTLTHQEVLDFWGPILSNPTGPSTGLTLAPSSIPLPPSSSTSHPSDSDSDDLDSDEIASFFKPLLPDRTTFFIHGPLLPNDPDDSDFNSDSESDSDVELDEDGKEDEELEFAPDEDDDAMEFAFGPQIRAEERKVKQQAGMENWAGLKLSQLKEECERRGLAKSGG